MSTDSFNNGTNAVYVDRMFAAWKADPQSVHQSWQAYFANMESGVGSPQAYMAPPSIQAGTSTSASAAPSSTASVKKEVEDHLKVQNLVRSFQSGGHHIADLDPLGILDADLDGTIPPELQVETYGFSEKDLDRRFQLASTHMEGIGGEDKAEMTLRDIIASAKRAYTGQLAVEYGHISSRTQCNWIRKHIETVEPHIVSKKEKRLILSRLVRAHEFEAFLARKWSSEKRFGLEGGESLIPGLKAMVDTGSELGVDTIFLGMPHRGRLNVLGNVMRKPLEDIFFEFTPSPVAKTDELEGMGDCAGDVKYHLGASHTRELPSTGNSMHMSLASNPSHLEAVNPLVIGKAHAEQVIKQDEDGTKVMPLLLHGDAAFAGQGVVAETISMTHLKHYKVGGTVHVVVNNQIGFTTNSWQGRSSAYCTDVAKLVGAPIFHVNGDNPEAVVRACQLAVEFRQKFHNDVVVDIVCFRKNGHNEIDQPMFTQPRMYTAIKKHPATAVMYAKQLISEGVVTQADVDTEVNKYAAILTKSYEGSKKWVYHPQTWLEHRWKGLHKFTRSSTGVDLEQLCRLGQIISSYPEKFVPHVNLLRIFEARKESLQSPESLVDWATAESLAFASLLKDKIHVRLSGQDVERGTFSHRHAIIHDQKTFEQYCQLDNVDADQARFTVVNSPLNEFSVLGFELGYSLVSPDRLVMWEAQFGDFSNTAQCMFDQFLSAGESKWMRQSGLTVLLPHGYEGMGAEHSSARLERFLQMSDDDEQGFPGLSPATAEKQIRKNNWVVVNITEPANFFHVLRRQVFRDFRKPLIVMSPKSLLRHPQAKSPLSAFGPDTSFQRLLTDPHAAPESVKRVVFCTGKIYYELDQVRTEESLSDVALVRLEQIAPFPFDLVADQMKKYNKASEVVWCQEEPKNMGAWAYVRPRFETALAGTQPAYAGRAPSAATATGVKATFKTEQHDLIEAALK
jgi:2-oxoglutarate dehydrogenase E1 component